MADGPGATVAASPTGEENERFAEAEDHQLHDAAWKRRRLEYSQQRPKELLQTLGPRLYMEQAKTDLNLTLHHQVMALHKANEEAYQMISYLTKQLSEANRNYDKLVDLVLQKIDHLEGSGVLLVAEWELNDADRPDAAAARSAASQRQDALNILWGPRAKQ